MLAMFEQAPNCELCSQLGGDLIWQNEHLRVVLVDEPFYQGFTRVIWHQHVREMTDLSLQERNHFMQVVWTVEETMRDVLHVHKINLASLGNQTPHLHWHVIPRFSNDAHFPKPIWADVDTSKTASVSAINHDVLNAYTNALKIALWDLRLDS